MMRDRVMNGIGFALIAVCFVWAAGRIFLRARAESDPGQITLRFAHWQLEGGIREAFDALARRYMALHPHVRVEQMLIPERVYPNWLITQLVGGTAPDLIEVRAGMPEDRIARYFLPLTQAIGEPNPYNAGTSLNGVPWRDTFLDGLAAPPSYIPDLLDFYAIPTAMFSVRLYYNKDLYARIAGDAPLPRTFDEFIAICERVNAYAQRHGQIRGEGDYPTTQRTRRSRPSIFFLFECCRSAAPPAERRNYSSRDGV